MLFLSSLKSQTENRKFDVLMIDGISTLYQKHRFEQKYSEKTNFENCFSILKNLLSFQSFYLFYTKLAFFTKDKGEYNRYFPNEWEDLVDLRLEIYHSKTEKKFQTPKSIIKLIFQAISQSYFFDINQTKITFQKKK